MKTIAEMINYSFCIDFDPDKTVKKIVEERLESDEMDGLYNDFDTIGEDLSCSCRLDDDIMPCEHPNLENCRAFKDDDNQEEGENENE